MFNVKKKGFGCPLIMPSVYKVILMVASDKSSDSLHIITKFIDKIKDKNGKKTLYSTSRVPIEKRLSGLFAKFLKSNPKLKKWTSCLIQQELAVYLKYVNEGCVLLLHAVEPVGDYCMQGD